MADLSLNGLSKHYGDFYAVREVSLTIADGEFLVLLGPSGCGKTTTLRMVAGFIEPTAGHVRLAGQDVTLLPPWKRNAGMVFQSYALFPHMTVAQNVAFGLEMRKLPPRRHRAPRRGGAGAGAARRLRRPPAAPALGRPAAARGAGPRARHPARRAAARRAALQPRRQAAPGGAGRDPRAAAPARPHHRHGHPRPGRGADHGRPAGGHERGLGAPGRHASATSTSGRPTASSRASSAAPPSSPAAVEAPGRFRSDGGLALACAGGNPGRAALSLRPERVEIGLQPRSGLDNSLPGTVEFVSYLGALIDIHVRLSPSDRLVVQIANREGGFTPEVGQPVHVGWPASAGQVFNE